MLSGNLGYYGTPARIYTIYTPDVESYKKNYFLLMKIFWF